jgi:uncharacterized protein YlaI
MKRCELCGRAVETTKHHLIPKNRRDSPIARLCSPCHEQVHAAFTHHELKQDFHAVDRLRDADRLQSFLAWIRKTDKTDIRVKETERVRKWRE